MAACHNVINSISISDNAYSAMFATIMLSAYQTGLSLIIVIVTYHTPVLVGASSTLNVIESLANTTANTTGTTLLHYFQHYC